MASKTPREVVIDTSVLIIALCLNFTKSKPNIERKKILEDVVISDNIPELRKLDGFFANIAVLHTTAHAIGELSGLVNSKLKLSSEQKSIFWGISIKYLKNKQLNENLIELISLNENSHFSTIINEIGYVDAGLIKLAKELDKPIISNDKRTLKKFADFQNVNVLILNDDIWMYI